MRKCRKATIAPMSDSWTPDQMASQDGRRFLITGANSGVGYSAAVELARHGAVVILACRDRARGQAALEQLRRDATGPQSRASDAELIDLDLASLESVRAVAEAELDRGLPLHALINNAGVMAPPRRLETKEGFELQFGTNVIGHFALTCRLMPALMLARESIPEDAPRVVTLSSIAHKRGKIEFDDLQSRRNYNPMAAYAQSKLADLMFAFELDRRLKAAHIAMVSIAVHPGVARSNLFKVGNSQGLARVAETLLQHSIGSLLNSQAGGAVPTLFAAASPEAKSGAYYGSQGLNEMRGGDVGPAKIAEQAKDQAAWARLWGVCEELSGITLTL